jgi:uncharacterized protein YecT (DUF1311 family)
MSFQHGWGLFLCVLSFNVLAQTQLELNHSACGELKHADRKLNQVYQQIITKHSNDTIFITHFKEAQRKWIAFRDAYVDSMYIPEYYTTYGSIRPLCQCYFIEKITNDRLKQLQLWTDGVEEGDACVGSTGS